MRIYKKVIFSLFIPGTLILASALGLINDQAARSSSPSSPVIQPKDPSQAKPDFLTQSRVSVTGTLDAALEQTNDIQMLDTAMSPGIFRGDWGETPIYRRHDRVNHQGAEYMSLENANQNQPPDTNPSYWRLMQTLKTARAENCQAPQPGADLSQCDFTETVSLKDRPLQQAQLSKARLSGELGSADLSGADLSGASVIGSLVISPSTRLQGANLSNLQSDGNNPVIAEGANLGLVNLSDANLYGARLKAIQLQQAQLTGSILTGAELTDSHLEGADMSRSNLSYANLTQAVFSAATLVAADLGEANLNQADFSAANLQQANLAGADLTGIDLSGADLTGANLSGAKGMDSVLIDEQTQFNDAICPDGVNVDGQQVTTCMGHGI